MFQMRSGQFVAPYLALCRDIVKTGNQWRMMPHDFPPWYVVYQQTRRWMAAQCFETMGEACACCASLLGAMDSPAQ
jgi:transposase